MNKAIEDRNGINSLELPILSIISQSPAPIGACTVVENLAEQGIKVSEAGIGRALRHFRQEGLLERKGFQGHIITEAGDTRLKKLRETKQYGEMLRNLTSGDKETKNNITDILIARRAIESEAAYQASLRATPEEIKELESIISAQYHGMDEGEDYTEFSSAFHKAVVRIAKSPMLSNLYNLIGFTIQWQNFFIDTFKIYGQPINVPHEEIALAIKNRVPEKAASLMYKHISLLIENASRLHIDN